MAREMKRGDTYPDLTGVCTDIQGPVPLGNASQVLVVMASAGTVIQGVCTVVAPAAGREDPDCGRWRYAFVAADTSLIGSFSVEVQVTWNVGQIQTFPENPALNETFTVNPDLNP